MRKYLFCQDQPHDVVGEAGRVLLAETKLLAYWSSRSENPRPTAILRSPSIPPNCMNSMFAFAHEIRPKHLPGAVVADQFMRDGSLKILYAAMILAYQIHGPRWNTPFVLRSSPPRRVHHPAPAGKSPKPDSLHARRSRKLAKERGDDGICLRFPDPDRRVFVRRESEATAGGPDGTGMDAFSTSRIRSFIALMRWIVGVLRQLPWSVKYHPAMSCFTCHSLLSPRRTTSPSSWG